MALIRNNKPSRVGLPVKKGGATMYFEPGTHEYPDDKLGELDRQRASVRAYWEAQGGKPAVLEDVTEGGGTADPTPDEKRPAAELKEMITESSDPDWLRSVIEKDDRTTVIAAADNRLVEVLANIQDAPPEPPEDEDVASGE